MRRVISLWLPLLATDRIARTRNAKTRPETRGAPLVTVTGLHASGSASGSTSGSTNGGARGGARLAVAALNRPAEAAGLGPGLTLADARARCPGVRVVPADPAGDARTLARLAAWCGRYTPWTAVDASAAAAGPNGSALAAGGLWLDITGCGHLFGGEAALVSDLVVRLADFGFSARAAVADTPGAAWAWARFGAQAAGAIPPGETRERLSPLPVVALRLAPALVETLDRLGLRRVGELYDLPRAALTARFGDALARRLDQALGHVAEPISPLRPTAPHAVRLAFPEPVARPEALTGGLDRLLDRLCRRLARAQLGARRLVFTLYRGDGSTAHAAIGTSRPVRAPAHLARLFAPRLESLDPAPGVEILTLAATVTEPLIAAQSALPRSGHHPGRSAAPPDAAFGALVDRLANRLGAGNVLRFAPHESHLPERAVVAIPALAGDALPALAGAAGNGAAWPQSRRPLRLLSRPERIEADAPVPNDSTHGPPPQFRWRRVLYHVARADGPERIAPEWWRLDGSAGEPTREYYRVEDTEGRRLWLYRAGRDWFLHGIFG